MLFEQCGCVEAADIPGALSQQQGETIVCDTNSLEFFAIFRFDHDCYRRCSAATAAAAAAATSAPGTVLSGCAGRAGMKDPVAKIVDAVYADCREIAGEHSTFSTYLVALSAIGFAEKYLLP